VARRPRQRRRRDATAPLLEPAAQQVLLDHRPVRGRHPQLAAGARHHRRQQIVARVDRQVRQHRATGEDQPALLPERGERAGQEAGDLVGDLPRQGEHHLGRAADVLDTFDSDRQRVIAERDRARATGRDQPDPDRRRAEACHLPHSRRDRTAAAAAIVTRRVASAVPPGKGGDDRRRPQTSHPRRAKLGAEPP
jgi:hypothetical protein